MYVNETKIKVRYVETDQMGIVHHSNYYPWFEVGRTEFFEQTGLPYAEIEQQGVLFPLIKSSCTYKEGAKYQDELTIKTWIQELSGAKGTFQYEVVRDRDGKIIAEGKTVHAFVNKAFRPINLKKVNPILWGRLQSLSMRDD
ncbi:thioesterase family protein [Petroclostridium sp. X23]|uniref:acyl-CoA thioesterase n=1 Tax=Petroclostridium sp. X23 TaxID=3045146 RepID=UPI0024ADC4F1|nr:thioesterase family protein [Petroclostridium sp. X23]WHH60465.1 thioesterase family protein [Petroclostridium sp. X23]